MMSDEQVRALLAAVQRYDASHDCHYALQRIVIPACKAALSPPNTETNGEFPG